MFNLNDRVVYPGHGVAVIRRILKKNLGKQVFMFYELKFINKDASILVPTDNTNSAGIRPLSSSEKINIVYTFLAEPVKKLSYSEFCGNWKQRNKEYQSKLRNGDLLSIAKIYRELKHIEQYKELSFCEKNLLLQTEFLLAEEISLVKNVLIDSIIEYIRAFFPAVRPMSSHVVQKVI